MIVDTNDGGGVATGEDTKPIMSYIRHDQDENEEDDYEEEHHTNQLVIDDAYNSTQQGCSSGSGNDTDSETYSNINGSGPYSSSTAFNTGRRKQHKPIRY